MEYNLVKLEELRKVTSPNDDDLILLSNIDTGVYTSTHMTVADAFNSINIRLSGAQQKPFADLRDTSCIDLDIDESSLQTQADANQAILDIFNTFGSHICELEDAVAEPFVIIEPSAPDATDLEDGWMWADSSGYTGYDLYVLDGGNWVPVSSASEGEKGEQGEDGKSAYEIWLEQGNTGTEQEFLDSLKGEDGDAATIVVLDTVTGPSGTDADVENVGTENAAELIFTIPAGQDGVSPKVEVGKTEQLEHDEAPRVEDVGVAPDVKLDFYIPKGEPGPSHLDLDYDQLPANNVITPELADGTTGGPAVLLPVTHQLAGLMLPADKQKLDGLSDAINYRGEINLTDANDSQYPYPTDPQPGDIYINIGVGSIEIPPYIGLETYGDVAGKEICIFDGTDWAIIGSTDIDASVDLDYEEDMYMGTVTNTAGTPAVIPIVAADHAGLMTPDDKIKLDSIPTDAYDGSAVIEFEQSDWSEVNLDNPAYIHNKPNLDLKYTPAVDKGFVEYKDNLYGYDSAEIPLVDDTNAGLMSPEDRDLLYSLIPDAYEEDGFVKITGDVMTGKLSSPLLQTGLLLEMEEHELEVIETTTRSTGTVLDDLEIVDDMQSVYFVKEVNGMLFAGGRERPHLKYSIDGGVTWNPVNGLPLNLYPSDIDGGDGHFVMIDDNYTRTAYYSDDGINWQQTSTNFGSNVPFCISYCNGVFFIGGANGTNFYAAISTDFGANFTAIDSSNFAGATESLGSSLTVGDKIYVVSMRREQNLYVNDSDDFTSWISLGAVNEFPGVPNNSYPRKLFKVNDLYVCMNFYGSAFTDDIESGNWTRGNVSGDGISYTGQEYVVAASQGVSSAGINTPSYIIGKDLLDVQIYDAAEYAITRPKATTVADSQLIIAGGGIATVDVRPEADLYFDGKKLAYEKDILQINNIENRVELIEDNLELKPFALEMDYEFDGFYHRTVITTNEHPEFAQYDYSWAIDLNGNGNFTLVESLSDIDKDKLGFVDASSYLLRMTDSTEYPDALVKYTATVSFGEKFDDDGNRVDNELDQPALSPIAHGADFTISPWGTTP